MVGSRYSWFALRVKSNRERVTSLSLKGKGYEAFLPEYKTSSRKGASAAERPLFPGYLFCRFDINDRLPVVSLPGIVHIVGFGKRPVPVDDTEIESLKVVVNAGLPVHREEQFMVGQQIRIEKGPLAGAAGFIAGMEKQRLVVAITLLQRSVSVELERDWIVPLTSLSSQEMAAAAGQSNRPSNYRGVN